jgi:hypothetical protein
MGTPCRSWSRARWPPLRDRRHLCDGLPDLSPHELAIVREGNELLRRSLVVLKFAINMGLLVSLENPEGCLLWLHPEVRACVQDFKLHTTETHYCQWSAPYKKPTVFCANFLSLLILKEYVWVDTFTFTLR